MLEDTLKWRADFRPEALTVEALAEEATLGKMYILDAPDVEGRPVVFMCPRKERPGGDISGRLKWVVYVMEAASRLADESGARRGGAGRGGAGRGGAGDKVAGIRHVAATR
jgi:hypothetical protein